jgi:hypothetical protein
MTTISRRLFLTLSGFGIAGISLRKVAVAQDSRRPPAVTMEEYMEEVRVDKSSDSPLKLQKFKEPIYLVLEPVVWTPNAGQADFPKVQVPKGFVTDLASIPAIFWSILPKDAAYAYAAIVHDYLYWIQHYPRSTADAILKKSMEDFEISKPTVAAIHTAVVHFGASAWRRNAELRKLGERRVLKRFPIDNRTTWAQWKLRGDVFADV